MNCVVSCTIWMERIYSIVVPEQVLDGAFVDPYQYLLVECVYVLIYHVGSLLKLYVREREIHGCKAVFAFFSKRRRMNERSVLVRWYLVCIPYPVRVLMIYLYCTLYHMTSI